jgi:hypothetical protein
MTGVFGSKQRITFSQEESLSQVLCLTERVYHNGDLSEFFLIALSENMRKIIKVTFAILQIQVPVCLGWYPPPY